MGTELTIYALLVGVNEYLSPDVPNLQGCVNDVYRFHEMLKGTWNVPDENIVVLVNESATRTSIQRAFREHLIERAKNISSASNDTSPAFLFHFSGHGSQNRDQDWDLDEVDGWDETIVPHDSRTTDVYDILDDEIREWLTEIAQYTSNLTLVFDCCHSGTISRTMKLSRSGGPRTDEIPEGARRCLPDSRLEVETGSIHPVKRTARFGPAPGSPTDGYEDIRYLLITGCQDDQESFEITQLEGSERKLFGTLTYYLTEGLSEQTVSESILCRNIFESAREKVRHRNSDRQLPNYLGNLDQEWFRLR